MKRRSEKNQYKTTFGVGTSVTVKVREINENTREGKSEGCERRWLAKFKQNGVAMTNNLGVHLLL